MKDVAAAAGVSIKTVSNALNGYPFMKEATRDRVLAAAEELQYRFNKTAQALRSGKRGLIGLAVPDLRNAYFAELADACMEAAERRGVTVLIHQTQGERDRELDSIHGSFSSIVDGVLLNALALGDDDATLLRGNKPVVLLGDHLNHPPVDHITMHNERAAEDMTAYLLRTGRRRIAVIGAHENEIVGSAGLRLSGYRSAHAKAGIPVDEDLIGYVQRWHRSDGAATMQAILDRGVKFDAVFGLNDMLALGATRTLQRHHINIPNDVAVAGFDDLEESSYALPTLTTINPGVAEIADRAIATLIDRIEGSTAEPTVYYTAYSIMRRDSTDGARAEQSAETTMPSLSHSSGR